MSHLPPHSSRWGPGVSIQLHSRRYHEELMEHTFCLAFPGDGWSSRVLDAVVHGCIPVVIQVSTSYPLHTSELSTFLRAPLPLSTPITTLLLVTIPF